MVDEGVDEKDEENASDVPNPTKGKERGEKKKMRRREKEGREQEGGERECRKVRERVGGRAA
jgi:hypothetical protein